MRIENLFFRRGIDTADDCSVCLESFSIDEKIYILSCNHIFHEKCFDSWLPYNSSCPICRGVIYSLNLGCQTAKKWLKKNILISFVGGAFALTVFAIYVKRMVSEYSDMNFLCLSTHSENICKEAERMRDSVDFVTKTPLPFVSVVVGAVAFLVIKMISDIFQYYYSTENKTRFLFYRKTTIRKTEESNMFFTVN